MPAATFQDSVKQTAGWQHATRPDPKTETAMQFYNAQGKKPKAPVLVAARRTQELEKEEWTDKVFTGDNPKTTAAMAQAAGARDEAANPKKASRLVAAATKSVQ